MTLKPELKTSLMSAIFTVLILVLLNYFFNHSWNLFSDNSANSQPFNVQGSGTATAKPDLAQVTFIVTKTAPKLTDAQDQTNTSISKIIADLKKLGLSDKDIKTSNYSSNPNYSDTSTTTQNIMMPVRPEQLSQNIISYTVTEDFDVSIKVTSKVNSVINTITKDNAENIYGPNFVFTDATQKKLQDQARTLAITDAKNKAVSMAKAAGLNLGRIVNIQENTNNIYPVQPLMMKASGGGVASSNTAQTTINPGENSVSDNVTLTFQTW